MQETIATYEAGKKKQAYKMFLNDKWANPGVSYDKFCEEVEKIIIRRKERIESENAHAAIMNGY